MLRNTTFALLTVLGFAAATQAGTITITKVQAPTTPATTSNPTAFVGWVTDTLTAVSSDPTDKIVGFDFVGDGTSKGLFGPMNQVNPFGLATVYTDNNAVIPAAGNTIDQDSQFKVASSTGVHVNDAESASKLQTAFSMSAASIATATSSLAFVQIAHNQLVNYVGSITVQAANGQQSLAQVSGTLPVGIIPEPATMSLLGLAMVGGFGFLRRRAA